MPAERFEIRPENRHVELWSLGIKSEFPVQTTVGIELKKADLAHTPREKFNCFADAYRLVVDSIDTFSKKKEGAGADDSTPVLVYLLLHSMPKKMFTTIKYHHIVHQPGSYIEQFGGWQTKAATQAEYCYRKIKSVAHYLDTYGPYETLLPISHRDKKTPAL